MTLPTTVFPCGFAFTYTDAELKAYRRLVAARQDQGPEFGAFHATMIVLIVGIGLSVTLAYQLGLIAASAMKPLLISTYLSFILGAAAHAFAIRLGYRRIARRHRAHAGEQSCEMMFEVDGIRCIDRRYDVRARWAAVAGVRESELLIVLWVGLRDGFVVPTRMFADAGARARFVAAAHDRIAAARSEKPSEDVVAR